LLDRIAHEQKTTKGQRDATDIDRPVRAERLFETAPWWLPGDKWRRLKRPGLLCVRQRVSGVADANPCPSDFPLALGPDLFGLLRLGGGSFVRFWSGSGGRQAMRYTRLRFEREDLAFRDVKASACANC
jgi:hypothetical protein